MWDPRGGLGGPLKLDTTPPHPPKHHSGFTHHVDGVYGADAVDKHVRVNHSWFDCKEAQKSKFREEQRATVTFIIIIILYNSF